METKKVTFDPVFEIFRLNKQLELLTKTMNMILDGSLYIHFEKRDEVLAEFNSSRRDVKKAMEPYFEELEREVKEFRAKQAA